MQAPHARGSLSILLNAICVACKFVEAAVRKVGRPPRLHGTRRAGRAAPTEPREEPQAGLAGILGMAGSANVQVRARPTLHDAAPRAAGLDLQRRLSSAGRGPEEAGHSCQRGVYQPADQVRAMRGAGERPAAARPAVQATALPVAARPACA